MDAVYSLTIAFYFHSEQGRCACVKMLILSLVTGPPTGRIYLPLALGIVGGGGGEEEREIEGDGT